MVPSFKVGNCFRSEIRSRRKGIPGVNHLLNQRMHFLVPFKILFILDTVFQISKDMSQTFLVLSTVFIICPVMVMHHCSLVILYRSAPYSFMSLFVQSEISGMLAISTGADRNISVLAIHPGICHVRTPDGSSFSADVQVSESQSYSSGGKAANFSLNITRVDPEELDGVSYAQWIGG